MNIQHLLPAGPEKVYIKPYSAKELAIIYGVGKKTFKKWIAPFDTEIGDKKGRFYTVAQVRIIFNRLGLPEVIDPGTISLQPQPSPVHPVAGRSGTPVWQ